jgi:hypothetical protein
MVDALNLGFNSFSRVWVQVPSEIIINVYKYYYRESLHLVKKKNLYV